MFTLSLSCGLGGIDPSDPSPLDSLDDEGLGLSWDMPNIFLMPNVLYVENGSVSNHPLIKAIAEIKKKKIQYEYELLTLNYCYTNTIRI